MADFYQTALGASSTYSSDPKEARAHAVATALEIIRAKVSSSSSQTTEQLKSEFNSLSSYANLIQAAMEGGNK
ncbi:hypothetical protein [Microbulbifer sp. ZKSA002]|uniref:hypothetical protein n=1 Tax=Microbulbifer sp. ZKSA002 TaxID=3243388 RepID=UPI0040396B73